MKHTTTKTNNAKAWNSLYREDYHSGGTFLPSWGIHSAGSLLSASLLHIKNNRVLEIACGIGESVPYILKNKPNEFIGIDISENAIEKANQNYQSDTISFLQADMSNKLAFNDNYFDEVFSIYGLGWSKNIQKTLNEIYRVLKPGGTFTFSWDHYLVRVIDEHEGKVFFKNSYNDEQPTIRHNWNQTGYNIKSQQARPSTWFQLLKNAGFEVTAFHEINTREKDEQKHVFSNTYSKIKTQYVPSAIIMQGRKP